MVFKCIEFPGKTFESKASMFAELKRNEKALISLKLSQIYKSSEKCQISFLNLDANKMSSANKAGFEVRSGFIYPVISTTNYMDSHKDVHFNGCFTKTVQEQQGKVYYALDHELKWNSILTWPKDVFMFIALLDWALVGKSYDGQTEGLVSEIDETKITKADVLEAIKQRKAEFENSIRMLYKKLRLAIDSNEKEYTENKAYFDSRIDSIANKEEAISEGYFWGVEELAVYKEGSLVIAGGSNDATAIIFENKEEAANSTSDDEEPPTGTQEREKSLLFNPNII